MIFIDSCKFGNNTSVGNAAISIELTNPDNLINITNTSFVNFFCKDDACLFDVKTTIVT